MPSGPVPCALTGIVESLTSPLECCPWQGLACIRCPLLPQAHSRKEQELTQGSTAVPRTEGFISQPRKLKTIVQTKGNLLELLSCICQTQLPPRTGALTAHLGQLQESKHHVLSSISSLPGSAKCLRAVFE